MRIVKRFFAVFTFAVMSVILSGSAFGASRQSSISMNLQSGSLSLQLLPMPGGNFGESGNATLTVSTDNYTGYNLTVNTSGGTSLVNHDDDAVESINSAISAQTFSSDSTYNNKWGFKPSQYVTTSGNVDTTVNNTNFLPAPSGQGLLVAKTSAANALDGNDNPVPDSYTFSFGARVDTTLPADTYQGVYVLTAVANDIVYNITYDENTADTVTNMPVPNPQATTIDGGTATADSYATLSDTKPVRNDKKFAGWCDVATTVDSTTGDDICSGTLYEAGDDLPVDQTAAPNITLYAVWVDTLFPIVWNQMGACEFHGATNGNITGSACSDYHNVRFIDTGIALYSQANYLKDYEIHFTLDHYLPSEQVDYFGSEDNGQQTFVNDKLGSHALDEKAPGVVVRRSKNNIEFNSKMGDLQLKKEINYTHVHDVSMFRLDNKIYYSYDGGPLIFLQDITGFNQQFDLTAWFGAYPRDDCDGSQGPCTNVKRIPEATMSNMYIRLGEYSDDDIHTISFKKNDGTTTNLATYLIKDGNSITTLPEDPTYADHLFQGWFTAQSDGTQVTASTVPSASTDYYAHWLGTVAIADIDNPAITLEPNDTETVIINNASELEPYTFSSDNDNVATVNQTTGEITAVGPGTAIVTITGSTSGETKTVTVTVTGQVIYVSFDSQGGTPASYVWDVGDGSSFATLPAPTKTDYELEGWYTGTSGTGTKLTTSTVFDSNTPTQYYANWEERPYVCMIAKQLHTETCGWSTSKGCKSAGFDFGDTITYGNLVESTTMNYGDAYNCDINYDKTWSESNERFYYIGSNNGIASFVFYNNVPDVNLNYTDAMNSIPNTSPDNDDWINPGLQTLGSKVTRFMTVDEVTEICGGNSNIATRISGTDKGRCGYLAENSSYAYETGKLDTIWLQQVNGSNRRIHLKDGRNIATPAATSINGPRVVIEVPLNLVEPYVPVVTYEITFNPHNETNSWTETIDAGDDLSDVYPATDPSYTNHLFQGWFTAETGGSQISSSTEPTADTTYHAQWLKTVALAELQRDTIAVEPSGTANIVVTNSSELEPYTFTSNNTSIATVDSAGEITGVTNGTTTITMTGATSGATKSITVNVTTLLPVTQAIIGNNDLTTMEGEQTTVIVTNSAELEPYTFSSADTSIATVDSVGVITGVSAGTTNIIMTGSMSGLTKTLEVEITAAPVTLYTVTFNPNGGSFNDPRDSSKRVEDGTAVGALPTPTKSNYMFFGWYKDDGTFYQEVYPEETIDDDVTYYAKWVENTSSFPIVWAETNACTFNGTSNLTGDYCLEDAVSGNSIDKTKHYIDTAIQLFTQANFQKDFEVGLNIVSFDGSSSTSQATFVTSKAENLSGWPGFTLRRSSSTANLEFTERFSMNSQAVSAPLVAISSVNQVKIARIGEKIYYSWNDAPYTLLQDISANTTRFDTKVWFGATLNSAGTGSQRPIYATFTDMYVKLGVPTDYVIELDVNDGSMNDPSSFTVPINSPLGTLPTPTPPNENYTFIGWFDESVTPAVQVTSATIPDGNKVYVAHYSYDSSDEPVIFNIANDALQGYQTLINSWVPSPINITTFNQSSPINDSTWGDTSELSEKGFWEGIKDNFEDNLCSIPSYSDAVKPLNTLTNWGNGSYDCSKPKAYDTKIGAALNVYLDDENGEQVTYANATNGIIHNMVPGQTYYWEKADDSTVYGYVTATSVNGRRPIELSANRNTRDLGGLPVSYTDGNNQTVTGTLAYGRLFRGERLWNTPATELYNLGINKQYDVGDPKEYANDTKLSDYKWDPVVHYDFEYHSGDENNASSNYMKAWTAVTDIMTDITSANNPKNIYFHCRVGADRTGTTAYLLEGLLGVPDEARYEEYELTNLSGLYDRTRYYKLKSSSNNLKFVYMMGYVKTNADILNWYMSNPNSDMNLVQAFRAAMTVPNNQQNGGMGNNSGSLNSGGLTSLSTLRQSNAGSSIKTQVESIDVKDGYFAPLNAFETTDSVSSPSGNGLMIAATAASAAVAVSGSLSYVLIKDDKEQKV